MSNAIYRLSESQFSFDSTYSVLRWQEVVNAGLQSMDCKAVMVDIFQDYIPVFAACAAEDSVLLFLSAMRRAENISLDSLRPNRVLLQRLYPLAL